MNQESRFYMLLPKEKKNKGEERDQPGGKKTICDRQTVIRRPRPQKGKKKGMGKKKDGRADRVCFARKGDHKFFFGDKGPPGPFFVSSHARKKKGRKRGEDNSRRGDRKRGEMLEHSP